MRWILKWRFWRWGVLLVLGGLLLWGVGPATVLPAHTLQAEIEQVTGPYRFHFFGWISEAIADEVGRRTGGPEVSVTDTELVNTYLTYEQELSRLEADMAQLTANCAGNCEEGLAILRENLAATRAAHAEILPEVEMILARQVETVLREEGFTVAGRVFPPVAFRLVDPPTGLVVSPRDEIKNEGFFGLQPGLDDSVRESVETALGARGDVSPYVTNIGGLSSYPAMVIQHGWLPALLDVIAHEWTHNYLYTFPSNIAWGYRSHPRLLVVNETVASLVGQEVSRKVIHRFYPEWVEDLPEVDPRSQQPGPVEPSPFQVAMRDIRLEVDRLLAVGKIEEAEAYMEAERLRLVEQGYALRKLNQAYFAFHGSYALTPGSVDPIGAEIRALRAASPSLQAFLERAGWLNSAADYEQWAAELEAHAAQESEGDYD